jgi:hypothetical protein
MARILSTNGGSHPPEKWSMTTAEQIFDIGSTVAGDRLIQAQKLQLSIAEALMPHYAKMQEDQRSKLESDAKSILVPPNVDDRVEAVMKDVINAAKGTAWQAHFANPEVQAAAREVLANHFRSSLHVERLWHADRNPDCEVSQSYKAMFAA